MLDGAGSHEEAQLWPEKEQEIASRILKRAELAQMTRQLKMKLGKVPTSRESSPVKVRKRRGDGGCDPEIKEAIAKVSPVKKGRAEDEGETSEECGSPVKQMKRWSTPPPVPPTSSSSVLPDRSDDMGIPTTPRRVRRSHHTVPPVVISSANGVEVNGRSMSMLTTPKSKPQGRKSGSNENEVGADLLMYLATSPYTSASSAHQSTKVPSTPRNYMSNGAGLEDSQDAIRFSHMKPQASSPQSTFKVPTHLARQGSYSQGHSAHFPASSSELLMDSPAIYMATATSPEKRRQLAVPEPSNVPTTPSRELRSTSHLLRTPNFNMGDYVHALFSPSPRVASSATSRPASTQDLRPSKS